MDETFEVLNELERELVTELKKLTKKGDLNPVEVENANKAVCLLSKIKEYKYDGMDNVEPSRSYSNNSWNNGYSRNRNSMRRSRMTSNMGMPYENANSYHSIKDRMIDKLESMMDEASSQYERDTIGDWINYLETKN